MCSGKKDQTMPGGMLAQASKADVAVRAKAKMQQALSTAIKIENETEFGSKAAASTGVYL